MKIKERFFDGNKYVTLETEVSVVGFYHQLPDGKLSKLKADKPTDGTVVVQYPNDPIPGAIPKAKVLNWDEL